MTGDARASRVLPTPRIERGLAPIPQTSRLGCQGFPQRATAEVRRLIGLGKRARTRFTNHAEVGVDSESTVPIGDTEPLRNIPAYKSVVISLRPAPPAAA